MSCWYSSALFSCSLMKLNLVVLCCLWFHLCLLPLLTFSLYATSWTLWMKPHSPFFLWLHISFYIFVVFYFGFILYFLLICIQWLLNTYAFNNLNFLAPDTHSPRQDEELKISYSDSVSSLRHFLNMWGRHVLDTTEQPLAVSQDLLQPCSHTR